MPLTMIDLLPPLLRNTGVLAFVAVLYGLYLSHWRAPNSWALGALCGTGAVLSMVDPITVAPGVIVDSRTTMLTLAGFFGGPLAAAIAGATAAIARIWIGGLGVTAGLGVIAIGTLLGVVGHRLVASRGRPMERRDILLLALAAPVCSLGTLLLPSADVSKVLGDTFLPISIVRVLGVAFLGLALLHEQRRVAAEAAVRRLAYVDELSGLANRRALFEELGRTWHRWTRYGHPFSVIVIDIDHFKRINDRYGHEGGDEVIRRLGRMIGEGVRGSDLAARIGGEEFVIILPNTTSSGARVIAERIRAAVEAEKFAFGEEPATFTISAGVSDDLTPQTVERDVLPGADKALYEAKRAGRNQVRVRGDDARGRPAALAPAGLTPSEQPL